jgi:mono/diheme cytochrome c family protein
LATGLRVAALATGLAWCSTASAQSRGELLYATHCGACHSAQMHWRDKKQVLDWTSLRAQVRFWQSQAMLGWNDEDIQQVARYLNDTYYRMPPPAERTGALMPAARSQHRALHDPH